MLLTLLLLRSDRASSMSSFARPLQTSIRCLINASECTAGLLAAQWMGVSSLLFLKAREQCHMKRSAIKSYTKYQSQNPMDYKWSQTLHMWVNLQYISANTWPCQLCWGCGHMRHACHTLVDAYIPVLLLKCIPLQVKKWLGHLGVALLAGQMERQISIVVLHQNCITANINQNAHNPRKCDKVTLCKHIHTCIHVHTCIIYEHVNIREVLCTLSHTVVHGIIIHFLHHTYTKHVHTTKKM